MNDFENLQNLAPLRFCGTVMAAFSHDFKNALAIINENAGLLQDLVAMAGRQGRPPDAERLKKVADRIDRQVQRADRMAGHLNRFAHSVDHTAVATDLAPMLGLVGALSARPAALRKVTLEVIEPAADVQVTTFPFALQRLLYLSIESLLDAAGSGGCIRIEAVPTAEGIEVRITARKLETETGENEDGMTFGVEVQAQAAALGATFEACSQPAGCLLRWPRPQRTTQPA